MKLTEELAYRGFINQTTYTDLTVLDDKKITFYHGYDASADSQTIGNLAGMMIDRLLMRHGHRAVILAGGSTSLIGDPGGKDEERPLQDEKTIAHNIEKAQEQLTRIFAGHHFELVNNLDWTKNLTVIEFLRNYGKHFSMTTLTHRDFIARRLGENSAGISYAEFSYTILQGMDYLRLYEDKGVTLQIGGSDQWGNILSGVDLVRKIHSKEVHALTLPLVINQTTGKKFGKTEEGAVWLDPVKTTPFQFYQFWVNVDDIGVENYLKIYTELSREEIDGILSEFNKNPGTRIAQKALAYEVTKIVHGKAEAEKQKRVTEILFGENSETILSPDELDVIRNEMQNIKTNPGASVIEVLVETGLASSNSEARRLQQGGAIYVNNQKFEKTHLEKDDFINGLIFLRRGKAFKDTALVELQ